MQQANAGPSKRVGFTSSSYCYSCYCVLAVPLPLQCLTLCTLSWGSEGMVQALQLLMAPEVPVGVERLLLRLSGPFSRASALCITPHTQA